MTRRSFAVLFATVLAGCADGSHASPPANNPPLAKDGAKDGDKPPGSEEPSMTTTDPRSPQAWVEAGALAQKAASGPVTKHGDALPFFYDSSRGAILVHHGKVVTERGAVVAGAYLRDIGIIRGVGPTIDDAVYVLSALDALPTVDKLARDAFVHTSDPKLADAVPRIETDGQTARIVLHYLLAGAPVQKVDPDPTHRHVGSPTQSDMKVRVQPVARMSLTIPAQGDASWARENINLAVPL
jgi:hypothetical protein